MTGSFRFERTWGAEPGPDGAARFRIWAPGQGSVSLVATASGAIEPMRPAGEGWFALKSCAVAVGESYAFALGDGGMRVPDPAARAQAGDVHGPSLLVDPGAYRWETADWQGRPWPEAVVYELHTGSFTQDGTFAGVEAKLDHLVETGVTAIELMPVAQFSGNRGWGYDGVLLYAPHVAYGGPDGLKRLVDRAHARGLMVLLDVVYNHFGPDGNYLGLYAPQFFDASRQTPWGTAIDYAKTPVRRFFIENALYWLEEFRLDGLRLDAIDQIRDRSTPHILEELASEVRQRLGKRHIHLTTEDERNITRLHARDDTGRPRLYTAEWNDDVHHVAHVIATGEQEGYYADYLVQPAAKLARALAEGYVYQGEPSRFHEGRPRGEPSRKLPPLAFVNFLQNHDQIGNRAFGERLTVLAEPETIELLTAIVLLSPQVPMLYMGEEWGEVRPFHFFTDFRGDLANAVREGRRNEFRRWPQFADPQLRARIPDPNAIETFERSRLDWSAPARLPFSRRLALVRRLLDVRRRELAPRLAAVKGDAALAREVDGDVMRVTWSLDGARYSVVANLSGAVSRLGARITQGLRDDDRLIFELPEGAGKRLAAGELPAWSCAFRVATGQQR
jgi:malto-oligosyltrehalose trehalohydrolase